MMYDDSTMMCDNVRLCMMIDSRIRGNWIVMLMLMLWVSTICIICISKTSMTFTQIPSANHGINKSHLIQILHQDLFRTKLLALLKQRNATKQTTRKWCPFGNFPRNPSSKFQKNLDSGGYLQFKIGKQLQYQLTFLGKSFSPRNPLEPHPPGKNSEKLIRFRR